MIKSYKLYHVQDSDGPMWVAAKDYTQAIARWKQVVAAESGEPLEDIDEPAGVTLICEADELLLPPIGTP